MPRAGLPPRLDQLSKVWGESYIGIFRYFDGWPKMGKNGVISPATRTNGCALVAPGLAGRLPSAAIELPPAMALEDGCDLYDAAIVDG